MTKTIKKTKYSAYFKRPILLKWNELWSGKRCHRPKAYGPPPATCAPRIDFSHLWAVWPDHDPWSRTFEAAHRDALERANLAQYRILIMEDGLCSWIPNPRPVAAVGSMGSSID